MSRGIKGCKKVPLLCPPEARKCRGTRLRLWMVIKISSGWLDTWGLHKFLK